MKLPNRSLLHRSIVLALSAPACFGGLSLSVHAAESETSADKRTQTLEEVVVTARRKEEKLQDVPTSITAISSKDLSDMRIDSIVAVGQAIPNVYIQQQGGSVAPQLQFRGISNGSLNPQVDSGVGVYVDGVYLGRVGAASFDIADLAQVEVMRGPQGTLFGRNSTGGAINMITTAPTGEFDFHAEMGFGNYNDRRQKVSLDLPVWNGLAARITVGHQENNGWVSNSAPRSTFNFSNGFGSKTTSDTGGANNKDMAVIALRYTGIDRLKVDYKYDYNDNTLTLAYRQLMNLDPQTPPAGYAQVSLPVGFSYQSSLPAPFETPTRMKVEGHSLTAQYEISDSVTAKYIGGFRKYNINYGINGFYGAGLWTNGTSFWTPGWTVRNEDQHQSSHEFQLLGKSASWDWIAGLFLFEEKAKLDNPISIGALGGGILTPGALTMIDPGTNYFIGQKVTTDNRSNAIYGHATWHINQWDISGGYRHTQDNRKEHVDYAGHLAFGPFVVLPGIVNQDFNYSGSHNDYDLSATYKITPDVNVYAKYATGYVSGGSLQGKSFLPEEVKSYEFGVKANALQNHLRFNGSVYHMKRTNLQVEGFSGTGYVLQNVGEAKSDGLELEVNYIPMEGLTLNGSYGYTKVNTDGQVRTYQPKQTLSAGMNYEFQRWNNGVRPSFRMDLSWRDDAYRLNCPAGLSQVKLGCGKPGEVANPALDQQAILKAQTNLSARYTLANIKLDTRTTGRVSIWGRNLLNNNKPEFLFTLGGNSITGTFQQPKTYGIDFAIDY
ncbi:MAG: TonB-dependent receptor [Proteobacteria bacterium]|nr:TonB-dependent receptor [Pseudomonadota bacterium]HQR03069.1 TonB-dependent receptor [Rhodocyclaceae bacterium]